jgi:hypothetical protein
MAVAPGMVGQLGSHRRRPTAVGRKKWPSVAAFQGGDRALVAEEGVDESCSWRGGGHWCCGAKMAWRWQFGWPAQTRGRGKRRGGDGLLKRELVREDERGKEKRAQR